MWSANDPARDLAGHHDGLRMGLSDPGYALRLHKAEALKMGKSHRDNHEARMKRGQEAFAKKAERRADPKRPKCLLCGLQVRPNTLIGGLCVRCSDPHSGRYSP